MILTEAQLLELTRKRRPSAQARVLGHAGIPFRARPDGSLIVLLIHVETIEGQPASASPEPEPIVTFIGERPSTDILPLETLRALPVVSEPYTQGGIVGLYFLWGEDVLLYIGMSVDVPYRISRHRKTKHFSHATWLEIPEFYLRDREGRYIHHYKPPLNMARLGCF